MIRVESKDLNSVDCQNLAKITMSVRKGTPLETDTTLEEIARNIEKLSAHDDFQILIAINENEEIVGWIYYYVAFPLMTFISGFFPIVDQTREAEAIALSLIEVSKKKLVELGHTRLELELEFPSNAHRALSKVYIDWYGKCGFQFAAEEVHMMCNLDKIEFPEVNLPNGFILEKFSDVNYEQIVSSGFLTFENSADDLFLSSSHTEKKVTLEHYFDISDAFIEDASFILMRDDEIIGFVITRIRDGEVRIGPIGVVPDVRRKGLANYLLVHVLKNLRNNGVKDVGIDMSINNHPAKGLYKRYGFKETYYKQFYYWSP